MLKKNPDPERLAFFAHQLFNFTSYNQVRPAHSIAALAAVQSCHVARSNTMYELEGMTLMLKASAQHLLLAQQ